MVCVCDEWVDGDTLEMRRYWGGWRGGYSVQKLGLLA